ncbi:hypothetical protein pb186bvf_012685 [Paramecium bursaria]
MLVTTRELLMIQDILQKRLEKGSPVQDILNKMKSQRPQLKTCLSDSSFNSEMDLRKTNLNQFKQSIIQSKQNIDNLIQISKQVDLLEANIENCLNGIRFVKEQLYMSVKREQALQHIQQVQDSMCKMLDDIQLNEINIIESMQMKPFHNIMAIYKKRLTEHQTQISDLTRQREQILQFNQLLQGFQSKINKMNVCVSFSNVQIQDQKENYNSNNTNNSNNSESPCFKRI